MKNILILGAGLSSSSLIRYLLHHSKANNWNVSIVDQNIELVQKKINNHPNGKALCFNALDRNERLPEIAKADIVISMLPAIFHVEVAKDCIALKKNLVTPSYISHEMKSLDEEAKHAGIIIMNEIGVDPGIDHMSACKIMEEIKNLGGELTSFKSYCGGLIAPECDDNPWNYKFTWNPRNVVLAAQGGAAKLIENGEYKYIPYSQIFNRLDQIEIPGFGMFEGYANRDSLSYRSVYGLDKIKTIYRGTLRKKGFSEAWNVFVQLGMTDDSYVLENSEELTARSYLNTFLPYHVSTSVEDKFKAFLGKDKLHLFSKFEFLDLFDNAKIIGQKNASPAKILETILVNKLSLKDSDIDMLVMYHAFEYEVNKIKKSIFSYMVNLGEDPVFTSMSNTVGLPVAICTKMILNNEIKQKGVVMPIYKDIYLPILNELEEYGIKFTDVWED
jgi:saccharopine dehydrogenase-like NADP-dependent oxidoreductase